MPFFRRLPRARMELRTPPRYLVSAIIVALVGLLNGLDTGTIGPVTTMPSFIATFGEISSTLHGLVVSSVLPTATLASLFAGLISDKLGRTRAIVIGAFTFAVGAAIEAASTNLGMFIGGRCIVGLGEGTFLSTLVVYICEISPPSKRGPLASTVQLLITSGIMIGYFTCYGTVNIASSLSWRLPLTIQAGVAMLGALVSHFCLLPSPRWLTHKGRFEEASRTWELLGISIEEREKELLEPEVIELDVQPAVQTPALDSHFLQRLKNNIINTATTFDKTTRPQMLLAVFLMSAQQLSGIDGVLYYVPLLFQQAGISSSSATFLASGISAIVIFVATIPAFLLSDKIGRRPSTIYGGLAITSCMLLMGILYASISVHGDHGAARWIIIVTIYVFAVSFSMTWAIGIKVFASEIQPVKTRAIATSLSQAANCVTNFFVAFITPVLLAKSSYAVYFLFGGCSAIAVVVCTLYMPETRGVDLERIGELFLKHRIRDVWILRVLHGQMSREKVELRDSGH